MKNKTISIIGIVSYILSVITSAENLEGKFICPIILIDISGILIIVFVVMATIRLWRKARHIAIILASSTIALFALTVIQEITLPEYGSISIILLNIAKIIRLITFIWAIIKLYKMKEVEQTIQPQSIYSSK